MEFVYRGFSIPGLPADVAHEELERIREENGKLTAEPIVEAARPESSPLHPAFNWDDESAAHQHRLWQARQLIRSIRVVHDEAEESEPVYIHVSRTDEDGGGSYEPIAVLVDSPDEMQTAIFYLRSRLESARNAVRDAEKAITRAKGEAPPLLAKIAGRLDRSLADADRMASV
jgi:hypothetical protein